MPTSEGLYIGEVVHRRVIPRRHALRYKVFSCLFDCSSIDQLSNRLTLFSRNRFNLFSFYDEDHGAGGDIEKYAFDVAAECGLANQVQRFSILCYPRILGYAFNPLTVYFGLDEEGAICLLIYEVRNTFGERMTYVIPATADENGIVSQTCAKSFYVSPFNKVEGNYHFHVTPIDDELTVGVALKAQDKPILTAFFRGEYNAFSDRSLLQALRKTGWMTVKVILAIHIEAVRLWMKGLRIAERPKVPKRQIQFMDSFGTLRATRLE